MSFDVIGFQTQYNNFRIWYWLRSLWRQIKFSHGWLQLKIFPRYDFKSQVDFNIINREMYGKPRCDFTKYMIKVDNHCKNYAKIIPQFWNIASYCDKIFYALLREKALRLVVDVDAHIFDPDFNFVPDHYWGLAPSQGVVGEPEDSTKHPSIGFNGTIVAFYVDPSNLWNNLFSWKTVHKWGSPNLNEGELFVDFSSIRKK